LTIQNFGGFAPRKYGSIADHMKFVEAKAFMTLIAANYEHIADVIEQRLRERK
jgi:hypothetical protein